MPNRVSRVHQQKIRQAWIRQQELEAEGWKRAEIIAQLAADLEVGKTTMYHWLNASWLRELHLEHLALGGQQEDRDWVFESMPSMVGQLIETRARLRTLAAIAILEEGGLVVKDLATRTGKSTAEVRDLLHRGDRQLLDQVRKTTLTSRRKGFLD